MRTLPLLAAALLLTPLAITAQDSSADYQEPHHRKALEIYRTIISFRSSEGHGQVPAVARYLADEFRAAGFPEQDIHVLPFTSADGGETAGLVVRYRGDGSAGKKPILLLGHMDVVDARPEDWERDPFTLIEKNGYF